MYNEINSIHAKDDFEMKLTKDILDGSELDNEKILINEK